MATEGDVKKKNSKAVWILIGSVVGLFVLVFIALLAFGSPSAETVFKDMQAEMLKTKTVIVDQEYKGTGDNGESINLKSKSYLNLESSKTLAAKGDFTVNLTSEGTPVAVKADYIQVGDSSYIRFSKLSSSDAEVGASFAQIESKIKGEWLKAREGDNFSTFGKIPLESLQNVLPTPFANLTDDQRKEVLKLLQDKDMFTVEESSKVQIGDETAYKYELSYNKDQYNKVAKAISGYVEYFKTGSEDSNEITSLTVWVNSKTKQIMKIEFTGTSKQGEVEGTLTFSAYNEKQTIQKPEDYSIESELIN